MECTIGWIGVACQMVFLHLQLHSRCIDRFFCGNNDHGFDKSRHILSSSPHWSRSQHIVWSMKWLCLQHSSKNSRNGSFNSHSLQVYMVTTKIFYFYFNQREIGSMLKILVDRFLALTNSNDAKIREMQRFYYFQETILFLLNYFNGLMLALSFPIQVNVCVNF